MNSVKNNFFRRSLAALLSVVMAIGLTFNTGTPLKVYAEETAGGYDRFRRGFRR